MQEQEPQKTSHEVSIALIQRDVEYIKQSISGIGTQIQVMDKNFVKREEFSQVMETLKDFHEQLKSKVNVTDFAPIQMTISRVNWLMIVAVVGAVLALVLK